MKRYRCFACGTEGPATQMLAAEGKPVCEKCVEQAARGKRVERILDPTLCARCNRDYGNQELQRIGRLPFCEECRQAVRNRPYPTWLRYAFAALLILAAFDFVHNGRYFSAYAHMVRAGRKIATGDVEHAIPLLESAAALVPEAEDLRTEIDLLKAIRLVQQDKSAEAVPLLLAHTRKYPEDEFAKQMLLQAEMGAAFDAKNYDAFLEKSRALAEKQPTNPVAVAGVASALACKYVATGDETFARQANERLEEAKRMSPAGSPEFAEYSQRIRYRLARREIITREEFNRRFPNGWNGEEKR